MTEIEENLNKRTKKTRTASTEKKVKPKKLSKAEQQIREIEASLVIPDNYFMVNTPELLDKFIEEYKRYKQEWGDEAYVFLDTETYGLNTFTNSLITVQVGFRTSRYFFIPLRPFKHEFSVGIPSIDFNYGCDKLRPLFSQDYQLVGANVKYDAHILYNWMGANVDFNWVWDTALAGGLLDENSSKGLKEWYKTYAMPDLIRQGKMSKAEMEKPTFKFGAIFDKIPFDEIPHRLAWYYAANDVYMTHVVWEYQKKSFENPSYKLDRVYKLFKEVEMPLIPILIQAERRGVKVNEKFLTEVVGATLNKKLDEILNGYDKDGEHINGIYDYLGRTIIVEKKKQRSKNKVKFYEYWREEEEFNLSSPKQVVEKLYNEHHILEPVMEYDRDAKKEVPKCSTDKKTLQRNIKAHPVIPLILEYRGLSKLIDAFVNALPEKLIDGVVHPSYNQLVRTGRMSCQSPNLKLWAA